MNENTMLPINSEKLKNILSDKGSIKDVANKIGYHYNSFYNAFKSGYLEQNIIHKLDEKIGIQYKSYKPGNVDDIEKENAMIKKYTVYLAPDHESPCMTFVFDAPDEEYNESLMTKFINQVITHSDDETIEITVKAGKTNE